MEWIKFKDRRPPLYGSRTIIRFAEDYNWAKKGRVIGPNKNIWKKDSVEWHEFHSGAKGYTTIPYDVLEWLDEGVFSKELVHGVKSITGVEVYVTKYNNGDVRFESEDGSSLPDFSYEAGKEELATSNIDNDFVGKVMRTQNSTFEDVITKNIEP